MATIDKNTIDNDVLRDQASKLLSTNDLLNANEFHIKLEPELGLIAIVAVSKAISSQAVLAPGLGGTRCVNYSSLLEAMADAAKLAATMNDKLRFAGLPYNGAKAVLVKLEVVVNREHYFAAYGKFIESLNGRIITGCDSGVSQQDMQLVAKHCQYITGLPEADENHDDLAYLTALGITEAMQAAVKYKLDKADLKKVKIAIQGLGKVGYSLAQILHEQGADLVVTDIDTAKIAQLCRHYPVLAVKPEEIYGADCDIFAPCGLGGTLNNQTIHQMTAKIICGAANNPLASADLDELLAQRAITYIPDFTANVGGTIYAAFKYQGASSAEVQAWLYKHLQHKIFTLLDYAASNKLSTVKAAKLLLSDSARLASKPQAYS